MADHGVAVELYYSGAWQDAPARISDAVKTSRGITRYGQNPNPAEANTTLDNTSEDYAPLSVVSDLYGLIGQNTPARIKADGSTLLTGEVASWAPDESVDGNDKWTKLEIAGVLQRIGRGTDPLYSALRRSIEWDDGTNLLYAYWPLTDPAGSTSAATGVIGSSISEVSPPRDMVVNDLGTGASMTFGAVEGPVTGTGAEKFPELIQNGAYGPRLEGRIPSAMSLAQQLWQFECIFRCETTETAAFDGLPIDFTIQTSAELGRVQVVLQGEGRVTIYYRDHDDNVVLAQPTNLGWPVVDGQWHHIRLVAEMTGFSTWQSTFYLDAIEIRSDGGLAGEIGAPDLVRVPGTLDGSSITIPETLSVGHVAFYDGTPDNWNAVYGYVGEASAGRFGRMCSEEGIDATIIGDVNASVPMGPQRSLTFLAHLDEIGLTDDALIFETKDSIGLTMRTGGSLHNQTSAFTVSRNGEVVPPLRPVLGDAGIRNDVTASSPAGATRRVVQTTGPRNIKLQSVDPEGVGRYGTKIDVNPSTDVALRDAAGWRVNIGTYAGTWYAEVVVDLDAAPHLIASVDALEIGDMFTLSDLPVSESVSAQDVIILGIVNSLYDGTRRTVRIFCMPAGPYMVGVLSETAGDTDPVLGRLETSGSTTTAPVAAGASSFTVDTPSGPKWTTTADDFPLDVMVGGQRVSISNITGAGTQTFTVQAGGHQVRYPIPSGAKVTVYQPLILTQQ